VTLLLTTKQVGERLRLKKRAVLARDVPRVRIGRGHGKILFREEDVELYIRSHVETKGVRGSLELRQVDIASFR